MKHAKVRVLASHRCVALGKRDLRQLSPLLLAARCHLNVLQYGVAVKQTGRGTAFAFERGHAAN